MKIFSRSKSVSCYKTADYTLETRCSIIDTVHEFEVVLVADMQRMEILRAESIIMRGPYSFCREISGLAARLAGVKIDNRVGSNIRQLMGGPKGCYQLEDLCMEAIKAIKQSGYAFTPGGMEELLQNFDAALKGTCHSHCYPLEEKIRACATPNLLIDTAFTR